MLADERVVGDGRERGTWETITAGCRLIICALPGGAWNRVEAEEA